MSKKNKKITVKDLRKHIINTKKVDGGKIHTIQTPNAGTIEIVEGNKHSKGGVNYIKTSDGVTHEIENNEVVLPTDKGPYVVSDYMNTDGTKNYNKNKTSYADVVKYLAMSGASKQDLEAIAMQTEIANGNDPNNPSSLIQDTNVMQQPKVNLEYQEPVKKYQQITDSQGNMLVPNRRTYPNDNMFQKAGRYIGNKYLQATGQHDAYYQEPEVKEYQQTNDRQSKSGQDNFWGNLFGPKRTEVQVGGDDVRLEDQGSLINNQSLEFNVLDGDTSSVYQNLYTNQIANRGTATVTTNLDTDETTTVDNDDAQDYSDVLRYNIKDGGLVITDKGGNVHNNVTQVSVPNRPSIFRKDLAGGNQVITNTTTTTPAWSYGNFNIAENTVDGETSYVLNDDETVNTFRGWMNDKYPDYTYDGEKLDPTGSNNKYVKHALKTYGSEFFKDGLEGNYARNKDGSMASESTTNTETTTKDLTLKEINELLKKKYQSPYKYKGGGHLKRMYQEPDFNTSFEGDYTNIPTDFKFDYDESLVPIEEDDGSYVAQTNWTHQDDKTPNVQPTAAQFRERGFNNANEWRAWVNKQPRFGSYDWGDLDYWGPKHQEAWKAMSGPPPPEIKEEEICVGAGCGEGSSFSSNTTPNKKITTDGGGGTKIPWKGIGIGAGILAAGYGLSKLGGGNDAIDHAMKQKPNLIPHVNLGEARLKLMNNDNELAMLDRERWTAMQKLKKGYNPSGTYIAKEYEISDDISAKKSTSFSNLNMTNAKIGNQEANLNVQLDMKQGDINSKIDVANQLERRDIREQQIAALDAKYSRRQQLISDLIKLGGQGIEAYATAKSKSTPLTKNPS